MKLLGYHNDKHVVASVARHDYNAKYYLRCWLKNIDDIMADGGQANVGDSAGYSRHRGKPIWIEIAQNYAELYNDWNQSLNSPRKYGIWNLKDVKILSPEEYPNTESFEWLAENEIWGTNGPNGDLPTTYVLLKNCEKEHLKKILALCESRGNSKLVEIVGYWLNKK